MTQSQPGAVLAAGIGVVVMVEVGVGVGVGVAEKLFGMLVLWMAAAAFVVLARTRTLDQATRTLCQSARWPRYGYLDL